MAGRRAAIVRAPHGKQVCCAGAGAMWAPCGLSSGIKCLQQFAACLQAYNLMKRPGKLGAASSVQRRPHD